MRSKTQKTVDIVENVAKALANPEVYGTIKYKEQSEAKVKQFIYPYLLQDVKSLYLDIQKCKEATAKKKAKENLLWEGNKNTTIHHLKLFHTNHRPDFVLEFNDITRIAIEVKMGDCGTSLREGLGQSLVYTTEYDFVIYLFIDTTKDGDIVKSLVNEKEIEFSDNLWYNHNIKMVIV